MIIQKEYRKNTLLRHSKTDLVEHCMMLEHNVNVLHETLDIQYKNYMQIMAKIASNEDMVVNLIYDLLNEYDIGLWRDIEYVDLAEYWVCLIDSGILDEGDIKKKLKEFLFAEKSSH